MTHLYLRKTIQKILTKITILSYLLSSVQVNAKNAEPILPIPYIHISNPQLVELGHALFHDVRLSKTNQVACASCHSLSMGGADGEVVSIGINSQKGHINSPSIFNCSLHFRQFWNGRAKDLWEQINMPIHSPIEMGSNWKDILNKLLKDPFYTKRFKQLFDDGLTSNNIKHAIVYFEESLLTPNSRFDHYLRGNKLALSKNELAGYQLFKSYGCTSCHQGVAIGGNLYQKMGILNNYFQDKKSISDADLGRFTITHKKADKFVFKVPSLRNIALTAPYFHDGSEQTLQGAVKVMMKYQLGQIDNDTDIQLIVDFLETLTGEYQGKLLKGKAIEKN